MTPPPPSAAFITVVSGLPRSGTSMMMRALDAGGIPALSDNSRAADIDNPFGYFEYEPVKALRRQAGWLEAARGHCVKIIYRLLYDLPDTLPYRIVFMERNLDEVIASQNEGSAMCRFLSVLLAASRYCRRIRKRRVFGKPERPVHQKGVEVIDVAVVTEAGSAWLLIGRGLTKRNVSR